MFGNEILGSIISWVVLGVVVGLILKFLLASRQNGGLWTTLLLGIGGAIVGGIFGRMVFGFGFMTHNSPEDFTVPSYMLNLLFAILGAIILTAAYRIFIDRSAADGE